MTAPRKTRRLHRSEVAAMWLYGAEYAKSGLSAIQFWTTLRLGQKDTARAMVYEIITAPKEPTP